MSLGANLQDAQETPRQAFPLRRRTSGDDELDMTPMVDLTFLLLIFFMVTAAFTVQKSIETPTPDENEEAAASRSVEDVENDEDYAVVKIDQENAFWIDDREARSRTRMVQILREIRDGAGAPAGAPRPTRLLVLASEEARHDRVVAALDAGPELGFEEVRLATWFDE